VQLFLAVLLKPPLTVDVAPLAVLLHPAPTNEYVPLAVFPRPPPTNDNKPLAVLPVPPPINAYTPELVFPEPPVIFLIVAVVAENVFALKPPVKFVAPDTVPPVKVPPPEDGRFK
jgi:hypothetical protein